MGGEEVRKSEKSGSPKVATELRNMEELFKFYCLFPSLILI
jgi:hypothetical protein